MFVCFFHFFFWGGGAWGRGLGRGGARVNEFFYMESKFKKKIYFFRGGGGEAKN